MLITFGLIPQRSHKNLLQKLPFPQSLLGGHYSRSILRYTQITQFLEVNERKDFSLCFFQINSVNSILYGSLLQHNYFFNSILFLSEAVAMWPWERHSPFFSHLQFSIGMPITVLSETIRFPEPLSQYLNRHTHTSKLRVLIWNVQAPTQKWGLST